MRQLADVLVICDTPQIKTWIMRRANLNSAVVDARILHLMTSSMLRAVKQDGKIAYVRTQEGNGFLRKFAELEELAGKEVFGSSQKDQNEPIMGKMM